ncbi:hypothetical protein ACWDAY_33565 [Streptomyces olivaceus]
MDQPTVGILHPGSMGAAIAACAATNATAVLWCESGRSAASVERAARFGLTPAATLAELLDRSGIVISLCPPAAAKDLARDVAGHSFSGVYVEANAINPERMQQISALLPDATVVDWLCSRIRAALVDGFGRQPSFARNRTSTIVRTELSCRACQIARVIPSFAVRISPV